MIVRSLRNWEHPGLDFFFSGAEHMLVVVYDRIHALALGITIAPKIGSTRHRLW
jgi:hypothetical protein